MHSAAGRGQADDPDALAAAGIGHYESWLTAGDPACLDSAIGELTAYLAAGPDDSTVPALLQQADIHGILAFLHGCRYEDADPANPADLTAAVSHGRAGLRCAAAAARPSPGGAAEASPEETAGLVAELHALLGLALARRLGGRLPRAHAEPAAARAELDEAIGELTAAAAGNPEFPADWPELAGTLGRLHYQRYDETAGQEQRDPADLDAAVHWLRTAAEGQPDDVWPAELLVIACWERYLAADRAADRDAVIAWGETALGLPDCTQSVISELVGLALLDRADDPGADPGPDRAKAIVRLESALAATPAADPGRGHLAAVLASACWQQLDGDTSSHADVDRMTSYAAEAWRLLPADDETRPEIGFYLGAGIHERLIRPDEPFDMADADLAIEALTAVEPAWLDNSAAHAQLVTSLGTFLAARGQANGSAADLAEARQWLEQALAEVPLSDPAWSETTQSLAAAMTALATLGMFTGDLDTAIRLVTEAAARPDAGAALPPLTRESLGVLLVQRAVFSGDRGDLDQGIEHLQAAWNLMEDGADSRVGIAYNLGASLLTRYQDRNDVQDLDAAGYYLGMARELSDGRPGLRSHLADFDAVMTATSALLQLAHGRADEAVTGMRTALSMLPPGHPLEARLRSDLSYALVSRAERGGGQADLLAARQEAHAAASALPANHLLRPIAVARDAAVRAAAAVAARDPLGLGEVAHSLTDALAALDPGHSERARFVLMLGTTYLSRHGITGDPADLDHAVHWLEAGRYELASRPGSPLLGPCLTRLANCHRMRGRWRVSRQTGLAALREFGRQVLLQTGTARGLRLARAAASEAAQIARWCLADKDPETAVTAIELGRGLVLQAATAVTGIPQMLADAGHTKLARQWQAALTSDRQAPWDTRQPADGYGEDLLAGGAALPVPDDLRGRVLEALAEHGTERLLAPPGAAEIGAALAETGADVLAYLIPPAEGQPGSALLVPAAGLPGTGVQLLPLPLPASLDSSPLASYLAAEAAVVTAQREAAVPGSPMAAAPGEDAVDAAFGRLRGALASLCDWAYAPVIAPLLERLRQWPLPGLPRLVLVPVGPLSAVPWHAARTRADGTVRYACADAVISYAASGRQLIEVSLRASLQPQASPVIVGDPAFELPFAGLEARVIRDRCYPAARYLGHAPRRSGLVPDRPGSPADVLGQLPSAGHDGASVLHLGCHATAVPSAPGRSHLLLADGQRLTVEEILQQAAGRPPRAAGGLVSLAACRTDEGGEEQDEALSLATAFLAAGAVTVVGARWEVPDDATSLLMFMFHHYLTTETAPPREALRRAQLWMLDPGRAAPSTMPAELAKDAAYPGHAEPAEWAAFTHQGR